MHFLRFELYTLLETKTLKVAGCTEIRIVSSTVYMTCSKHIQTKINKGELRLELELLKRFEAVQMEIELHIQRSRRPN